MEGCGSGGSLQVFLRANDGLGHGGLLVVGAGCLEDIADTWMEARGVAICNACLLVVTDEGFGNRGRLGDGFGGIVRTAFVESKMRTGRQWSYY